MIINLKSSHSALEHQGQLDVVENLPPYIQAPCQLTYHYRLQKERHYTLMFLHVSGTLTCCCQRCLAEFTHPYENRTVIALCDAEEVADKLMGDYECIVVSDHQVDLQDLIHDELHLYVPQQHVTSEECDPLTVQYLS